MSIKILKKLFQKPIFESVNDIEVKSISIKHVPVMLEIYEVFEPYFKTADYYGLLTNHTKEALVFIYLCTDIEPCELEKLGAAKLIPLFDKCLEVNLDFFTQTYSLNKRKELMQQKEQLEIKKPVSKMLQSRIVSTYKDL